MAWRSREKCATETGARAGERQSTTPSLVGTLHTEAVESGIRHRFGRSPELRVAGYGGTIRRTGPRVSCSY